MQLLTLLSFVAATSALSVYQWKGANLNFNNGAAWTGGVIPSASQTADMSDSVPTATTVTGSTSISALMLPTQGRILFGPNAELSFTGQASTGSVKFIPRPTDSAFDFACGNNWESKGVGETEFSPATYPPCALDTVQLMDGTSYGFFAEQGRKLTINGLRIGDVAITDVDDLPMFEFTGIRSQLDFDRQCDFVGLRDCFCPSSCVSTPEAIRDQDDMMYTVIKERASAQVDQMTTRNLYDVEVVLTPAAMGLSDSITVLQSLTTYIASQEAVATMTTALSDHLGLPMSAFSNVELAISSRVAMRYSVFAPQSMVTDLDGVSSNADGYSKDFTTSTFDSPGVAPVATAAEKAAVAGVAVAFVARALEPAANAASKCSGMDCSMKLNAIKTLALWFDRPIATYNNLCPVDSCPDADTLTTQIALEMVSKLGSLFTMSAKMATMSSIVSTLASTDFNKNKATEFISNVKTGLNRLTLDLNTMSNVASGARNTSVPAFKVGRTVPTVYLYQLGNSYNQGPFMAYLNSLLAGVSPVVEITSLTTAIAPTQQRRDLATSPIPNAELAVTMKTTTACQTTSMCAIQAGSVVTTAIQQRVELAALAYDIQYHPCFIKAPGVSGLDDSTVNRMWDDACLAQTATDWAVMHPRTTFNKLDVSTQDIANYVTELVKCDYRGAKPDGSCWAPNSEAPSKALAAAQSAFVTATSIVQAATTTTTTVAPKITVDPNDSASRSSGGSKSNNTGIIVAAICAAVVILAILAFVAMRNKNKNASGVTSSSSTSEPKQKDRTMVAFQNPMYDQVDGQTTSDPTYSNAETLGAADNTFHEPVFHQEPASSGGYMDTEPAVDDDEDDDYNDPGYMDVNINDDGDDGNDSDF